MTKRETCPNCGGYGIVSDYGYFGVEFYGEKDCPYCEGLGTIRPRDAKGRYVKINYD